MKGYVFEFLTPREKEKRAIEILRNLGYKGKIISEDRKILNSGEKACSLIGLLEIESKSELRKTIRGMVTELSKEKVAVYDEMHKVLTHKVSYYP